MAPLVQLLVSVLLRKGLDKLTEKEVSQMEMFLGLIRHGLTTVGGVLVAKGYIDAGLIEGVVGAIVTLLGAGWSIYDKKKRAV
jgi:hypothetical protein